MEARKDEESDSQPVTSATDDLPKHEEPNRSKTPSDEQSDVANIPIPKDTEKNEQKLQSVSSIIGRRRLSSPIVISDDESSVSSTTPKRMKSGEYEEFDPGDSFSASQTFSGAKRVFPLRSVATRSLVPLPPESVEPDVPQPQASSTAEILSDESD